ELYSKLGQLGWLGLGIPEAYGGSGGTWVDAALFYEEAGRFLLPGPFFSSGLLAAQLVLEAGSEEQKHNLLPHLARGEMVCTVAAAEPGAESDPKAMATTARPDNGVFLLDGTKLWVRYAPVAHLLLTTAHLNGDLRLFLVERTTPGLTITPMESLGGQGLSTVEYASVRVPLADVLERSQGAELLTEVQERANLMLCAYMVGAAQQALDMAVEYAKFRVAFGRPIGSFQALQHKMADIALSVDASRWITYYAAWLNAEGPSARRETLMALNYVGEALPQATAEAGQVFGGTGMMRDHDWGLFFRTVKGLELALGYRDELKEKIAQRLGLS
ncbi:MAG: acyl-CoA dehydrogenase family protein, partial [Dehalococcoidia bacterium]